MSENTIDDLVAEGRHMARNETIADIIAEMRGIRVREFQDYADRIEAAHRREVATTKESLAVGNSGNCAKLREAVIGLRDRISMFYKNEWIPYDEWEGANDDANSALAAPPRNCDVMGWRTAWKIWREKFHPETPAGYSAVVKGTEAFMDWFAAPATEKEGGAK